MTNDGFSAEDFAHTADLLRNDSEPIVRAALSNNINIILAALDRAALTAALPHLGSGEAVPVAWESQFGDGKNYLFYAKERAQLQVEVDGKGSIRPLYLHPAPPSSGLMEEVAAALQGMLRHSCVADSAPEDKDAEDHDAERAAARAIEKIRGKE